MKYIKNCPNCNKPIRYKNKSQLNNSIKLNCNCKKCGIKKMLETKREIKEFFTPQEAKERRKKHHQEYKQNPEIKEKIKGYQKEYQKEYSQRLEVIRKKKKTMKKYRQKPGIKKRTNEYNKKYRQKPKVKKRTNEQRRDRLKNDLIFKLNNNMSGGIYKSLKQQNMSKNKKHWEDLIGYTAEDLKKHIEKQFTSRMIWDNYGAWHIDHIIPKSFFKYTSTNDVEFKYCWSLYNLQPLWAKDNFKKHNKLLYSSF